MDYRTIEIFLDLVNTRNITRTSRRLYLSQSTVSKRLQALEEELGCQLIHRNPGRRAILLTRQGEQYISIAQRWKNLYEETEAMKNTSLSTILLGISESAYFGFIAPFLRRFLDEHPEIRIVASVYNSDQIYELMDEHLLDYGIVAYESSRQGIRCQCINRQRLCIIRHEENPEAGLSIAPGELDPSKEILFTGGNFRGLNQWRRRWLGDAGRCRLEINSIQGAVPFLQDSDRWAVCTPYMAEAIGKKLSLQVYQLADDSEIWEIFFLTREGEGSSLSKAAAAFETELAAYVQEFNEQN